MTFPFNGLIAAFREEGLIVAVLIGIAFGFVLERAGFGRADKLAAQFYLRDMRVFKVMFTAIVTAMLGLVTASALGFASLREISESIASWTWIWPMLVGGFVLGAGFIISGYCPGTSIVATASGNVDGLFTVAGVVTGTFVYSELLQIPRFQAFHNSGAKGAWFLYDVVKVPPQLLAVALAGFAILGFIGAEKVEAAVAGRRPAFGSRRLAFATLTALAVITLSTIALPPAPAGAAPVATKIGAPELAQIVVDAPWTVRILDIRDRAEFVKDRVPGSENVTAASLANVIDDGRRIVVVDDAFMAEWKADPLVKAMTSGAPPPPPPAPAGVIQKPKKHGGGCSS